MVTQEVSANPVATHYHHEGKLHQLIITTRYDGNMATVEGDVIKGVFAVDALDELTRATVRAWCQAWSMYKHNESLDHSSPCEGLDIVPSDSEPYCTVWNKDYDDLTITVQSSKPPVYAVIAALGQARAIQAIHDSVKNAAEGKEQQKYENSLTGGPKDLLDENPTPWRGQEVSANEATFPNADGKIVLAAWKEAQVFDTAISLPMAKKNESRLAIKGSQLIADEMQYEDGDLVAFPLSKVFATTVSQNDIPVLKVVTMGYGAITVWKYKKDGEKNFDYRKVIEAFELIGLDATADDFEVSSMNNALVVIKAKHSKDGNKEFKNIYGFWRKP